MEQGLGLTDENALRFQHFCNIGQQILAEWSEIHLASGADEERRAQFILKLCEPVGQGWLRHRAL